MSYNKIENKGLQVAIEVSSLLSLIGSGAVIISTFVTKNFFGKGKLWNRFIFILSFWDMCGSIDLLIRQLFFNSNGDDCKIYGLTIHFFFTNSILWTSAIALTIFLIAVLNKKIRDIEYYEPLIHIIILCVSLHLTVPLYIIDRNNTSNKPVLGDNIFWCWITKDFAKYRMYFFYIPIWIVFFFNTIMYISTEIICNKRKNESFINLSQTQNSFVKKNVVKRSDLYLLVLFVIWIWGTIDTIQNMINIQNPNYVIQFLHAFFTPLQGLLNSIVYFWFSVFEHISYLKKKDNIKNSTILNNANESNYLNSFFDNHNNNDNNDNSRLQLVKKLEVEKADYSLPMSPILKDVSLIDEKYSIAIKNKKANDYNLSTFTLDEDDTIYGKYYSNNNIFENSNSLSMTLNEITIKSNNSSNTNNNFKSSIKTGNKSNHRYKNSRSSNIIPEIPDISYKYY